jgi:hypothetical protein
VVRAHADPRHAWVRWALLGLILLAFARLLYALDAKNLWWDESLSLQRAEAPWLDLLLGRLYLYDGLLAVLTYDQHPFFFFLLQGLLVRGAGTSEFVLRLPAVMGATLFVPAVWTLGRWFVRRGVMPVGTPLWAALLAAAHPFLLWYGQEARPYALWATLALLSTYLLLQATEDRGRGWWWGAAVVALMFYTSHYYALFLLPVHVGLVALWVGRRSRVGAISVVVGAGITVSAIVGFAYWLYIVRQRGGENFNEVGWSILLPDLLNAYSLGLSVDLAQVWLLDWLFGLVALIGVGAILHRTQSSAAQRGRGLLALALVLGPVAVLLVALTLYPAYMNARHMSLILGGYLLLLAGGLAWLGGRGRWGRVGAAALALILIGGMGYSSLNYFTQEEYAKDDFTALGAYLDKRLAPGDLVLVQSPFAWRIFDYYTQIDAIPAAQAAGAQMARFGVPLQWKSWPERERYLADWTGDYRRVWLLLSNTHPYADPEMRTMSWLDEHLFKVQEIIYFSHSSLRSILYLPEVPVYSGLPVFLAQPRDVVFGDLIRVVGVETGAPVSDELALPVTLYWQAVSQPADRYKYLLTLEELLPDGSVRPLAVTEREPYDGAIPTIFWEPGKTIVEYTELPPTSWPVVDPSNPARYRLALQVYHADTLEKLPVSATGGLEAGADVVYLPYTPGQTTGQ